WRRARTEAHSAGASDSAGARRHGGAGRRPPPGAVCRRRAESLPANPAAACLSRRAAAPFRRRAPLARAWERPELPYGVLWPCSQLLTRSVFVVVDCRAGVRAQAGHETHGSGMQELTAAQEEFEGERGLRGLDAPELRPADPQGTGK